MVDNLKVSIYILVIIFEDVKFFLIICYVYLDLVYNVYRIKKM